MAVLSPAEQVAARAGRLAAEVEVPGRSPKRWGPDEANTADVLAGLSFTTSDPGCFKDTNFGLHRDVDIEWSDLALLLGLKIYGAGGATAWEGRLQERPGRHGAEDEVTPGAVGWQVALADRPFQEIYIDGDITKWGEPSVQRRLNLLAAGTPNVLTGNTSQAFVDSGVFRPSLVADFYGVQAVASQRPSAEFDYYGGGVDIGKLLFDQQGDVTAGWEKYAAIINNDAWGVVAALSANYSGAAESVEQKIEAASEGNKYASFFTSLVSGGAGTMANRELWRSPKVLGSHGLTVHGTWPAVGLYASDVIANIVGRFAPKLNYTTGPTGSIQPTEYPIPQLAFTEPIKASDAIPAINAYHQYSWGVEDNRTFFYRPTSTHRKRWRIRRSRGDGVELLGPQADAAVNGVVVTFTDAGGMKRTVGPPAFSTAYATSEALVDLRPINPVNIVGGGQKWGELSLGFVTDVAGATQIGAAWLGEQLSNASARGSVTVTGVVEDENGAFWPSWAMRAGDSATVVDGDKVERRIIETSYNADSRMINCNLDATPHRLEAIMEQMGIAVAGL